jgi:hypothetical protein
MFTELKEHPTEEIKEGMMTMSNQIGNINKQKLFWGEGG